MRRTWILGIVAAMFAPVLFAACGARSELPVPGQRNGEETPGDAGLDADADAFLDVADAFDAADDGPVIVHTEDCIEAGLTYIYVVTAEKELFAFDPSVNQFLPMIGTLDCPGTASGPFSMAVDRQGHAYVVYNDGNLFKVSTATAHCDATSFTPDPQQGFPTFGMGFSTDQGGPSETLFIAGSDLTTMPPPDSAGLASVDPMTFQFNFIAPFSESLGAGVELTGTGDDRLFGFFVDGVNNSTAICELDKKSGTILSQTDVPLPPGITDFAFAAWGGVFYLFHSEGVGTGATVSRYDPMDQSLEDVAHLPTEVVGVGVSTCAPAQ